MKGQKKSTYEGFYNLSLIISALFLLKTISRNLRKNGFLMCIPFEKITFKDILTFLKCVLINLIKCSSVFLMKNRQYLTLITLIVFEILVGIIVYNDIIHLYFSIFTCGFSIFFFVKLISFTLSCKGRISFLNFLNFLKYPTINYKEEFKTKINICWSFVFRKCLLLGIYSTILLFISDELANPALERLIYDFNVFLFVENFLVLSICTVLMFVLFFLIVFNCLLPILGELTFFADQNYYSDWWNKKTVRDFWSSWNKEMHLWFKMYIYKPLLRRGYSKKFALFTSFVVSGIFHEYVISVASKSLKFYTFFGFIVQIILMETTDRVAKRFPKLGNFIFWMMFCIIGQPICIWLIYRSQYNRNILQIQISFS